VSAADEIEIGHLEDLAADLTRALTMLGLGMQDDRRRDSCKNGGDEGRAQVPRDMGALEFLGLEVRDASTRIHDGLLAVAVAIRSTTGGAA